MHWLFNVLYCVLYEILKFAGRQTHPQPQRTHLHWLIEVFWKMICKETSFVFFFKVLVARSYSTALAQVTKGGSLLSCSINAYFSPVTTGTQLFLGLSKLLATQRSVQ